MSVGAGATQQVAPFTTAGQTAVYVITPNAATLHTQDALFVWSESGGDQGPDFLNNRTALWNAVYNGVNLIIHDRCVSGAPSILPGTWAPGTVVRSGNATTGNLFHNADGNGPGAQVLFAALAGLNGVLDFTDFTAGSLPG